jgi:hypothetical protein
MPGEDENTAAQERAVQTEAQAALAAQIEEAFRRRGIDPTGVDFERLARHQLDTTRRVENWLAPKAQSLHWQPHEIELPREWREVDRGDDGGARYVNASRRLLVILSCSVEADDRAWLHLSVSRASKDRLPSHGEMKLCKELFLGDREAYAVWPPKARYVNIQEVLHLFALLDPEATALPDFTGGTGSI